MVKAFYESCSLVNTYDTSQLMNENRTKHVGEYSMGPEFQSFFHGYPSPVFPPHQIQLMPSSLYYIEANGKKKKLVGKGHGYKL